MRRISIATGCMVAILSSPAVPAAAEMAPKRKPGLWEITTVAPVSGMTTIKTCVGQDDDIVRPADGDCTEPKVTPLNEGVTVDVVCTTKHGKQIISSTFTGDFETRYHATLKTTFEPPLGAIRRMGVKIDGKYLGADCPAGTGAAGQ